MTKLNLKKLRQRRDQGYAVPHDDTALLLDWIERAQRVFGNLAHAMEIDGYARINKEDILGTEVVKLLAELEEA